MMKDFFDLLAKMPKENISYVSGYEEIELKKIEALYGISIHGELKDFMLHAGRCDGGLIGDDPIILYRPAWSVRAHLRLQLGFFSELQEIGAYDYIKKPFVFSIESETQYYFLKTSDPSLIVFHYNENSGEIFNTGLTLSDYLVKTAATYNPFFDSNRVVCKGELLIIKY